MKQLPQYFVIKRDASNPLWQKYIDWLNETYGHILIGDANGYYGYGEVQYYSARLENFSNRPTLITLDQWDAIINPTLKPNLVPFTLEAWNAGAKPFTRDGREVKQLIEFTNTDETENLIGVLGKEIFSWQPTGRHDGHLVNPIDLMLEVPAIVDYLDICAETGTGAAFPTLVRWENAKVVTSIGYVKVITSGNSVTSEFFPTQSPS